MTLKRQMWGKNKQEKQAKLWPTLGTSNSLEDCTAFTECRSPAAHVLFMRPSICRSCQTAAAPQCLPTDS